MTKNLQKEQYGYLPLLFIKTYHKEIIKIEGYKKNK